MPSRTLSERAQIDRNVCLTLAVNIRHTLYDNSLQLNDYIRYYNMTDQRLRNLNDYANKRYNDIQASILAMVVMAILPFWHILVGSLKTLNCQ